MRLAVPATAAPGAHWITGVGRQSGLAAQSRFAVQIDWPEFHHGPLRDGNSPLENVLSASNMAGMRVRWSAPVSTASGLSSSSPAVAGGMLYVGSYDGKLCALDAVTGRSVWSAVTSGYIYSSPALANGVAYVGSMDNWFYAFDSATGQMLWRAFTGAVNSSSPAVSDGVVYIGSEDFRRYAFEAATGKPLWNAATGSYVYSSPAVANGLVYVGSYLAAAVRT